MLSLFSFYVETSAAMSYSEFRKRILNFNPVTFTPHCRKVFKNCGSRMISLMSVLEVLKPRWDQFVVSFYIDAFFPFLNRNVHFFASWIMCSSWLPFDNFSNRFSGICSVVELWGRTSVTPLKKTCKFRLGLPKKCLRIDRTMKESVDSSTVCCSNALRCSRFIQHPLIWPSYFSRKESLLEDVSNFWNYVYTREST